MKAFRRDISITAPLAVLAWLTLAPAASWAATCDGGVATLPADLVARAGAVRAYPTFCSIPRAPTDTPRPQALRTAVTDARLAGRQLTQDARPETFTLTETDVFAARARREATAPPPMPAPGGENTAAFVRETRARAAPPARPR